jgi:hypothetical protein
MWRLSLLRIAGSRSAGALTAVGLAMLLSGCRATEVGKVERQSYVPLAQSEIDRVLLLSADIYRGDNPGDGDDEVSVLSVTIKNENPFTIRQPEFRVGLYQDGKHILDARREMLSLPFSWVKGVDGKHPATIEVACGIPRQLAKVSWLPEDPSPAGQRTIHLTAWSGPVSYRAEVQLVSGKRETADRESEK